MFEENHLQRGEPADGAGVLATEGRAAPGCSPRPPRLLGGGRGATKGGKAAELVPFPSGVSVGNVCARVKRSDEIKINWALPHTAVCKV